MIQLILPGGLKMRDVEVNKVPVELYKILKFEGLVQSGAEAKAVIAEGQVLLNGQVETQKRKKIVADDIIEFGAEKLRVVFKEEQL
jgi:ribosome-associated protein